MAHLITPRLAPAAATLVSYIGSRLCVKSLSEQQKKSPPQDIIQKATEFVMPLVSTIPFFVPGISVIGSIALGVGAGIATSAIHYARQKFNALQQTDQEKEKPKNNSLEINLGNFNSEEEEPKTGHSETSIPSPPSSASRTERSQPSQTNQDNTDTQSRRSNTHYSCKPTARSLSHNVPGRPHLKLDYQRIDLPLKDASGKTIHAKSMSDFAEKASDEAILAVWSTIEKQLGSQKDLLTQGAHVNFKTYNGQFHAHIITPPKGETMQHGFTTSRNIEGSNLYKKSRHGRSNNNRDKKERQNRA